MSCTEPIDNRTCFACNSEFSETVADTTTERFIDVPGHSEVFMVFLWSDALPLNIITALKGTHFHFYCFCCSFYCAVWRPLRVSTYTMHSAYYIFLLVLLDQLGHSRISKLMNRLDLFFKKYLNIRNPF